MSNFQLVDPRGWEYDLHSIYSAYLGYFQHHHVPWYDRTWGHLFDSFDSFLTFSWPAITVTDLFTGRAHIVTRPNSLGAFIKMIKTRFGEALPVPPNILTVSPFETSSRHLWHISDGATYRKLFTTLPAAVLAAQKARVKAGEPEAIQALWEAKDKTFLAIDMEYNERNENSVLEFGYAVVRCGHLDAQGQWPPSPDNYRIGHYIVSEYVDKVFNRHTPTNPWHYAFGESQVVSKAKLPQIIQSVISSLATPDCETSANALVLVGHGISGDLARLDEMKIRRPHNMLVLDTSALERMLHNKGRRPAMLDPKSGAPRAPNTALSLDNLVRSIIPLKTSPQPSPMAPNPSLLPLGCTLHNAGNDAFMTLVALQALLAPSSITAPPRIKAGHIGRTHGPPGHISIPRLAVPMLTGMPTPNSTPPRISPAAVANAHAGYLDVVPSSARNNSSPMGRSSTLPLLSGPGSAKLRPQEDLADEFAQIRVSNEERRTRSRSPALREKGLTPPVSVTPKGARRFSSYNPLRDLF